MVLGNVMKTNLKIIHQAGLTLLEVLVSLGILATITTGIAAITNQQSEKTKASVVALHVKMVGTAAAEYIKDNYSLLLTTATATQPALIRVSDLITAEKLQPGFNSRNARGQETCVLVLKQGANNLTSVLITEGGESIDDLSLGQIASEIGAAGGAIYSLAAGNMRGAMGGWDTPIGAFANPNHLAQKCSGVGGNIAFAPGHPVMALWFADSQDASATLYRDSVPGNPTLNTMNTPIVMGSATIVWEGSGCSAVGAIARDNDGKMLTCQAGIWKGASSSSMTWKGTVANPGALPGAGNSAGDTYRVSGLANHAFTWNAQSNVWEALAVRADGTFHLPGAVYASGSSSSYGALTVLGQKNGWSGMNFKDTWGNNLGTLMMNADVAGFFNVWDNGWRWYVDNNGSSTQPGWASANAFIPNEKAWEGGGCGPEGRIVQSANQSGVILSCQSGVWRRQGSSGGYAVTVGETFNTGVSYHYQVRTQGATYCPNNQVLVGLYRTDPDDMFHFLCRNIYIQP